MRFAHVELSLDPTPRLVLQFAAAIEFDDPRALRRDQQAFQFVVKLAKLSNCFIAVASPLYALQSILVQKAPDFECVWREIALGR